ncbi:MAG: lipid A export permease/ATP-binding protein MsbA [Gammaproteobacteria bacterium]|nr:lipid A export permease/ATP-binding protein MsbA [Gammaproteobacteria bacterium]
MPPKQDRYGAAAVYRRLLRYVRTYWTTFTFAVLGMAVSAGSDTAFVALVKPMLDGSFVNKDPDAIRYIPFALVAVFIVRGMSGFVADTFMMKVGRNVIRDVRKQMFDKLLVLPVAYYDNTPSSQLISKLIYDTEQIYSTATKAILILVRDNLTIVGLLGAMIYYNWRLSLLFLLVGPVIMVLVVGIGNRLRRIGRRIQTSIGDVTRVAHEAIDGQRVIKTYGTQDYERAHFGVANEMACRQQKKMTATGALAEPITLLIGSLAFAAVLYIVTQPSMRDEMTVGTFMSFMTALMLLFSPMKRLTKINTTVQSGIAASQSIFEFLDTPEETDVGGQALQRARGQLEFRQVSFMYQGGAANVLEQVSFTVEPGQTIAIVGKSGSGKSTLVSLLPRFYDVSQGAIFLDGVDIRDLKLQDLRQQFAYVSQDITLFNDTIAQNIAYGHLAESGLEGVIAAADAAHATEFIRRLPQGFDTMVGENGVLLSGGQRQRIAIARALLKNAPLLLLDEATSALDSESEQHIQAALDNLTSNRTTLVIAHRLSTIEKADRILVLEQGRIVEHGSHRELLALKGVYAQLHQRQFKSQAPA